MHTVKQESRQPSGASRSIDSLIGACCEAGGIGKKKEMEEKSMAIQIWSVKGAKTVSSLVSIMNRVFTNAILRVSNCTDLDIYM